jgi:hypothetical protein
MIHQEQKPELFQLELVGIPLVQTESVTRMGSVLGLHISTAVPLLLLVII